MDLDASVTVWIEGLRRGDQLSAQQMWERYFAQLVQVAGKKLPRGIRRDFDAEDVALSAFHSLCVGVKEGKFPKLEDRDSLWSLLVVITARKAMHRMRTATAQKRGGGEVRGESVFLTHRDSDQQGAEGINQVIGREPTADFAAQVFYCLADTDAFVVGDNPNHRKVCDAESASFRYDAWRAGPPRCGPASLP